MSSLRPPPRDPSGTMPLALATLATLLVSILLDSQTRFHLGDSETFIVVRFPLDRPWLYANFVQALPRAVGDLSIIPKLQLAIAAGSAFALARALQLRFALPWPWAMIPVLAVLAEPLSAWWARSIMTDSLAASALCLTLAAALWPGSHLLARFLLVCSAAVLTMLARSVHAVPLAATGLGLLLVVWIGGRIRPSLAIGSKGTIATGLALLVALPLYAVVNTLVLRQVVGSLPIALNHDSSRFLLGAISPLLEERREMIPLPAEAQAALPPLTRENRLWHTFGPTGLAESLAREHGPRAEAVGLALTRQAILASPFGLVRLTLANWADYLDPRKSWNYHIRGIFSGTVDIMQPSSLSSGALERMQSWGIWQGVRPDWPQLNSPALRWFRWGGGASAVLLAWAATLSLPLTMLTRLRAVPEAWFAAGLATAIMGFLAGTVNEYVSRYLIAVVPPLTVLVAAWRATRRAS